MKIGIVGLGLIGGSLGRAIKKKTNHTVFAYDTGQETMLKGSLMEAYDGELTEETARELDILAVSVYPSGVNSVLERYAPLLKPDAVVFDCAGIKRGVVECMRKLAKRYPHLNFIGGHPMAGREFSGISHAIPSLFEKSTALIVPAAASITAVAAVKQLFLELGCEGVVITTADEHDDFIAYTSQLAHVVSNAYVKNSLANSHYGFSAGSFRDLTRVAKLNPEMWGQLMTENRDKLLDKLDTLIKELGKYRDALNGGDIETLKSLLQEGSDMKEGVEENRRQKLQARLYTDQDKK